MALEVPHAGLQLEEDFNGSSDHLPSQAFILDLSDDVIEGMIDAASQGQEIRLSLGNKPTLLYGRSFYHIEQTFEDDTDDIELYLSQPADSASKASRLPQLAMSLFRKPDLSNPWEQYPTISSDDEEEEFEDEYMTDPEDISDQPLGDLDTDIALLRNSLAQKEAEKKEKSTRVIEGTTPAPGSKRGANRVVGSLHKALSGKQSPFGRSSVSPRPSSPTLSAVRSPSLGPADASSSSQQAAEKGKRARVPIIHELALRDQPFDALWQKYDGAGESEFKTALDKVADLNEATQNYVLRKKYWRELDVWNYKYANEVDRQQAIDNAVRQYDRMRLTASDPEWDRLNPKDKRNQGISLSKMQSSIAKGSAAPRIKLQRADEDGTESSSASNGSGGRSSRDDSGETRSDDSAADSEGATPSPTRQTAATSAAAKKHLSAREAQEKRLLSTKRKPAPTPAVPPSSTKSSPAKATSKAGSEKQSKFKSKEFITDSDSSESEAAPLASSVSHSKSITAASPASKAAAASSKATSAALTASIPPSLLKARAKQEASATSPTARKPRPLPAKDAIESQITAKPLLKKRPRDDDDDDSSGGNSSSSSSGTPLMKRIKPGKPSLPTKEREKNSLPRPAMPSVRPPNPSPSSSSASGSGNGSIRGSASGSGSMSISASASASGGAGVHSGHNSTYGHSNGGTSMARSKSNSSTTSPVKPAKSSPLASSPPTNASELDVSSEDSVPPIRTSTTKKRKLDDDRRTNRYMDSDLSSSSSTTATKRRHLPDGLVEKALKFKEHYEKYEALYKDIASQANPPKEKVASLMSLHNRLQDMKRDITRETVIRV